MFFNIRAWGLFLKHLSYLGFNQSQVEACCEKILDLARFNSECEEETLRKQCRMPERIFKASLKILLKQNQISLRQEIKVSSLAKKPIANFYRLVSSGGFRKKKAHLNPSLGFKNLVLGLS